MEFNDKKLVCQDCLKEFVWSAGEQKFYADKGFNKPPIRCLECRKKKKVMFGKKEKTTIPDKPDKMYQIKCKNCAKVTEIPFQPEKPDDILCTDCFEKMKNQ